MMKEDKKSILHLPEPGKDAELDEASKIATEKVAVVSNITMELHCEHDDSIKTAEDLKELVPMSGRKIAQSRNASESSNNESNLAARIMTNPSPADKTSVDSSTKKEKMLSKKVKQNLGLIK